MLAKQLAITSTVLCLMTGATLAAWLIDKGPWKPAVPEAAFGKLVDAETKSLRATLDKGIVESGSRDKSEVKKNATKAKNSAMMIAVCAQSSMLANADNAKERAGLRDFALKIAKAIDDNKEDEAKSLAATLSATASVPGAKAKPIDLHKDYELSDLMTQFKVERSGGKEMEKKIKTLMQKRAALTPAEIADGIMIAYQTALIAQYAEAMAPEADAGPKKKADWIKWASEMGVLADEAAKIASAPKPDDKAIKAAFRKLDDNCAKCHKVFKDND